MADYKTMYIKLFNAVTNTINSLQAIQVETEEMFLSQVEPDITLLDSSASVTAVLPKT